MNNIEASVKTLLDTINSKFSAEGAKLVAKARSCKGFVKLTAGAGTITFVDASTGVMTWCGNVQNEADRAALVAKVFRGR